jgi:septum formation protein
VPLWVYPQPLVLASKSEVRRKMLEAAGILLEVKPAELDERKLEAGSRPATAHAAAALLARAKAGAVAERVPERTVLGADQTLSLGSERFSKPDGRAAARDQLRALSGKTHELHSAAALVIGGTAVFEHADGARLTMRALSDRFIESYLDAAGDRAMQSVGGYQIEGLGAQLFERIEGDYFTILGLPLLPVLHYFQRNGMIVE